MKREKDSYGTDAAGGFTLLEIVIVIAIFVALLAIGAPQLMAYVERGRGANCLSNRYHFEQGERTYYMEHNAVRLDTAQYLCPTGGVYAWMIADPTDSGYPKIACSVHGGGTSTTQTDPAPVTVPVAAPVTIPAPTAMWSMDEGSGNHIGVGEMKGQINGATWVAGKIGAGLSFGGIKDGLNDFVQIDKDSKLNLTDTGTLSAWINMDALTQYGGIIHKGDKKSYSDEAYSLQLYQGKLALELVDANGTAWRLQSGVTPALNAWTQVAATWDAGGMKLYINGDPVAATLFQGTSTTPWSNQSQTVVARVTDGNLQIGAQLDQSTGSTYRNYGFSGVIDEVGIYNKALSAAAIKAYTQSTL